MRMSSSEPVDLRLRVVAESIRLFAAQGYESTTVDQIAEAAGCRGGRCSAVRSKEDVIFADHEALLDSVAAQLADSVGDPYESVCAAAESVFAHFRPSSSGSSASATSSLRSALNTL